MENTLARVKDLLKVASLSLAIIVVIGGAWFYFESRVRQIVKDEVEKFVDLPKGSIVAYIGDNTSPPKGWIICGHRGESPDLNGRFLVGTTDLSKVGTTIGEPDETHHSHDVHIVSETEGTPRDRQPEPVKLKSLLDLPASELNRPLRELSGSGHVHFVDGSTSLSSTTPPAMHVLFLCKTSQ